MWIYTVVFILNNTDAMWLGCFATLGHSHSTMGFLRNNLKFRSLPIKPPTDWGWNKAIASQFSVGHINLDAQNSSNSWSNHVKFTLFIVYPLCDVHNLDHIASCSRGVSVQRTAGSDFWQSLDVGVFVESPIAVEENAYATMQHQLAASAPGPKYEAWKDRSQLKPIRPESIQETTSAWNVLGSSHVLPSLLQSLKVWALLIEVGCEVHAGDGPHPTIGQSIDLLFSLPEVFAGLPYYHSSKTYTRHIDLHTYTLCYYDKKTYALVIVANWPRR